MRLARRLQAQRQEHGVSAMGIALLARLNRAGRATPKALADAEDAQPQTLTRVIAGLEERGLIARAPDPDDGRQVLLSLTAEGRHVLTEHATTHVDWLTAAMEESLTEAERDLLHVAAGLLVKLAEHGR